MDIVNVVTTIESTLIEISVEVGEAALIAEFPFLGLPVIKQTWQFIVNRIVGKMSIALQKTTAIDIINFTEDERNKVAQKFKDKFQAVLNDPKSAPSIIAEAKDQFKKSYAALIAFRQS